MLSARPISLNADVDVYQQPILNTKTPGRKGLKGRSALQENALHNGAKTVLTKKNVLQTPFRPGTARRSLIMTRLPGHATNGGACSQMVRSHLYPCL